MQKQVKKIKIRVFEIINKAETGDWASRAFDIVIMSLIALSIISIVLESFASLKDKYHYVFQTFEYVSVAVFTLEYALRIWTADILFPTSKHPRLKYICSFMAIIDLLAILPFYLPFVSVDLRFLRMMRLLRLLRLLRVLKLGRYFEAFQVIMKVIKTSGPQLMMSVVICGFVMLFAAIIMYTVENPVQPEQFPNVISSLWWAICTLTTVGYGDVYPITSIGRFLASIISLVGIGIIAIPTGIIAAGFNQVINMNQDGRTPALIETIDISAMREDELLYLQAEISRKLNKHENENVNQKLPLSDK